LRVPPVIQGTNRDLEIARQSEDSDCLERKIQPVIDLTIFVSGVVNFQGKLASGDHLKEFINITYQGLQTEGHPSSYKTPR
jgi:hypothetical protein